MLWSKLFYFYKDLEIVVGIFFKYTFILMGMQYNAFGHGFIYFYCANCLEMGQVFQLTSYQFGVA